MKKKKFFKKKIGIFGGTFDPPHKGHLQIANYSLKKLRLDYLFWSITNKNPLKKKPMLTLEKRIFLSKKMVGQNKKIEIKSFDNHLKSNKTIELIKFLKKKIKRSDLYFIMGSDNLINFHKWHKCKNILKKSKLIVFDRHGYKKKSLNSKTYKSLNKRNLKFVNFNKVNISSSQLRKI